VSNGRKRFGFEKAVLGGAIQLLGQRLSRERGAVELQIELADPHRQAGLRQRGEVLLDVRHA
jgi:hypothetical protein